MTAQDPELSAALGWPGGISDPVLDREVLLRMVAALMQDKLWEDHRVRHLWDHTLAQQAEPLNLADPAVQKRLASQWGYVPAAAQAEPVAWIYQNMYTEQEYLVWKKGTGGRNWRPLYTAPPQRLPLTEEEILLAVGWERAEMYMKLAPNFPVDEAKQETLKNARAVERAVWEKNHGQA